MNQTIDPSVDPSRKSILVIDDDKPTCIFFRALLSKDGFEVQTAYGGEEGLNLLRLGSYQQFDLIVLDLMMPKYGGYEVLKELQQSGYQEAPVLIATARPLDQGTVELIKAESNVRGFWSKPIDSGKFKTKVHEILGTNPQN